ncbi:2-C-methyl-D-erythritol 4-phosphate cytidylyltransferase [Lederbergia lenta]|uniref:2-C-methyl-D-erythritol 4-phosphate cytidylyltransferase n=1 Tax=Lederbergia lenta TaxID=1467 RepID=A0A2X4VG38_LEDLE|nr:2-C-methyl-D-erythritol 4-phosphate cytidylyltransferase [Lederbergia lenta]MEC2326285.1 2-C-methyl-D-erythritol 4-phosphate cytidylyltransferase [Lederbergia lenta]SQI51166.1 2-C-methyl-D-erythritol 4-phosphate cytidylyltransferase [Lederbergia lenta]
MDYQVIIPAAGSGKRMGAGYNKLFLKLDKRPIILHTLDVFGSDQHCNKIILVIQQDEKDIFTELLLKSRYASKIEIVYGGDERQYSVYNGLNSALNSGIILVHDGARPFIRLKTIGRLVEVAAESGAAIAAVPVKDTIKKAIDLEVVETVERSSLWQVQTPQAFRFSVLMDAHNMASKEDFFGTDEASLVERTGQSVKIVESDYDNIKLTTPEDIYFAEAIMAKRKRSS